MNLLVTKHRESIDALGFLRRCLRYCEGKPTIAADGGPWYLWPARRLGLRHIVLRGDERNYIERWYKTFKKQMDAFDRYFPTDRLETVENFGATFCFWYNHCRYHMSLGEPPCAGEGGLKRWSEC